MTDLWQHVDRIADTVLVASPVIWWLRKWLRRIENTTAFTKDVATTHLPHVYWRLRRSDDALKLSVVEHPSIVFVANGGVPESKAPGGPNG